jgi:hypothetical protein
MPAGRVRIVILAFQLLLEFLLFLCRFVATFGVDGGLLCCSMPNLLRECATRREYCA